MSDTLEAVSRKSKEPSSAARLIKIFDEFGGQASLLDVAVLRLDVERRLTINDPTEKQKLLAVRDPAL